MHVCARVESARERVVAHVMRHVHQQRVERVDARLRRDAQVARHARDTHFAPNLKHGTARRKALCIARKGSLLRLGALRQRTRKSGR
eukprot:3023507-Pleurochrysis_carterae.AAC.3